MKLSEILATKGAETITIPCRATVGDAIRRMAEHRVGAVLIVDSDECSVGIFTERDVLNMYADGRTDLEAVKVADCMTCSVVTGTPDTTVDEALTRMTAGRFRHLPVMAGDEVVGLVSIGDLVKARLDETAAEAQSLREYILS